MLDIVALGLKSITFIGVVVSAIGMNIPIARERFGGGFFALGIAGVVLMIVNARIAMNANTLTLDVAYAVACATILGWVLHRPTRSIPPAPTSEAA